ncbi:MAG: 23S rRNA (uracil(1939)-C(5))-methyltransferase RlmD [Armatimonadaceae bacterium]
MTGRGLATGGTTAARVVGPEGAEQVGMTAFVPFLVPGETARAAIRKQSKRFLEAEVVEVQELSTDRVEPFCPYFGACGGCDLQHMTYEAQLREKGAMVQGAFRAGGFSEEVLELIASVVGGNPREYRRRVALHVQNDGSIGYFRRRSHNLLPVADCPVAVPKIREFLQSEPRLPAGFGEGTLYLEATTDQIFGSLRLSDRPTQSTVPLLNVLESWFSGASVDLGRPTGEEAFEWSETPRIAGEFSQANATVNEWLVETVQRLARKTGAKGAYDLYAGAGNFGLPLAAEEIETVAVEVSPALTTAGRQAARQRGLLPKIRFRTGTVEDFLEEDPEPVDFVIADPPRSGLGKLAERFTFSEQLVLISCHLPSAVRDLKTLTDAGWQIVAIIPFDMFAQTTHIELLTHLRKD